MSALRLLPFLALTPLAWAMSPPDPADLEGASLHETLIPFGIPKVETYYPRETGVKGLVNGFAVLPEGELAILTNMGLLTFDGTNWENIPGIGYANVLTTVSIGEDEVPILSYDVGIGSLEADKVGRYVLTNIADHVEADLSLPSPKSIAKARGRLFALYGKDIVTLSPEGETTLHPLPNWATSCFAIGDDIWVTGGLSSLLNRWNWETDSPEDATDALSGADHYEWITLVRPRKEGGVWLLTQSSLVIGFDGEKSWMWEGNELLEKLGLTVTSFVDLGDSTLALGTLQNGLQVIEPGKDAPLLQYSVEHGLDDPRIDQVGVDSQNGIWLATENALSRVSTARATYLFDERHGLVQDASCMATFQGRLWIGTPQGLYASNPKPRKAGEVFELFHDGPEVTDLLVYDDKLFVATQSPFYLDESLHRVPLDVEAIYTLWQPSQYPKTLLAGSPFGVHRITEKEGVWSHQGLLSGPQASIHTIGEGAGNTLFASLGGDTLLRIHLDDTLGYVEAFEIDKNYEGNWTTLVTVEGDALVNYKQCGRWDPEAERFVESEFFYYYGAPPYGFQQVFGASPDRVFIGRNSRSAFCYPRPAPEVIGIISSIGNAADTRATCLEYDGWNNIWAGGHFGVIYSRAPDKANTTPSILPRIHRIITSRTQTFLPTVSEESNPVHLPHSNNSITVSLEYPNLESATHHQYQIFVEGLDSESEPFGDLKRRELNNLAPGSYKIYANAIDSTGQQYTSEPYFVIVGKPWHRTGLAFAGYVAGGILIVFVSARIYNHTQVKRSRELSNLVATRTREIAAKNKELYGQATELEAKNEELEEKTEELTVTTERLTSALEELQETQNRLLETARTAGKAEIAINVLHNVGNVLNSINVSINMLNDKLADSHISKLTRLAELIESKRDELGEFLSEDPRGKVVPDFLIQLSDSLLEENDFVKHELAILEEDIDHVKSIITAQQSHAKGQNVIEKVELQELCLSALAILGNDQMSSLFEIINEVPPGIYIETDKHRLLDIVLNLLSNAQDAIREQEPELGVITLTADKASDGRIELSITDNGIGISPEAREKLFRHGFTTKSDGHGFGLHSCANAAKQLGGDLSLDSPGPGQGATATLTLPRG